MKIFRPFVETPRRRRGAAALAVLLCGGLLAAGTSVGGGFPFGGSGVEEPDLIHVFPILPFVPEARVALDRTLAFLGGR